MSIAQIPTIVLLVYLVFFGIGVYLLLLLVKLINRGIKALDIYIDNNDKTFNSNIKK
jgi:hypothetical protein